MLSPDTIKDFELAITNDKVVEYIQEQHLKHCKGKCLQGKPIFWSCKPGRTHALTKTKYITDKDCYIIDSIFKYLSTCNPRPKVSFEVSKAYALMASGITKVYMGSDKESESVGFHYGNNFWSAELPILLRNCEDVIFCIVVTEGTKTRVVKRLSYHNDTITLPVWRRCWYKLDNPLLRESYVDDCKSESDYDMWRTKPARSYVTYDRLKRIAQHWRSVAGV